MLHNENDVAQTWQVMYAAAIRALLGETVDANAGFKIRNFEMAHGESFRCK